MMNRRYCSNSVSLLKPLFLLVAFLIVPAANAEDERESQLKLLRPGVQLSMIAEHPGLATPTGIDIDKQGRIWVVATHTHFRPDDYVGPEHDEVLVFSDEDSDGKVEQRNVFYNATDATMDLELGPDGWVYLAERDRIIRIKDSDGDGKADVEQNVASLETEADYPHNGLEGLTWHPGGDLIFGIGENFAKPWTLTGSDGNSVSGTGEGGIFRCSAKGNNLRRIAKGFWNPFGICVRSDGEIFAAENDPGERPPCRLLHIVKGGDYGYQRMYGPGAHHPFVGWNGELRGTLPMIHPSGEAPCGVLPLGRGLLVPSWSDHRIDFFLLKRKGASFAADRIALAQGGRYFRPACIASADGAEGGSGSKRTWYFTDWVDGRYQAHGFGRLWKLEIDLNKADWVGDLAPEPLTDKGRLAAELRVGETTIDRMTLVGHSKDKDPFVARAALLALSKEASQWQPDEIRGWDAVDRVQAVLALKLAEASPEQWVPPFLQDDSADVQFETLRWIADARLEAFRPNVEQVLHRSDIDYLRFEAAIATLNALDGKPEAGIQNPEMLLARVLDDDSSPKLRAYALRLLPTRSNNAAKGRPPVRTFHKGLTLKTLEKLLSVNNQTLSMEAVRVLAGDPSTSKQLLTSIAGNTKLSALLRAEAIAGLAAVADQHTEILLQLAKDDQRVVREEALRCLREDILTAEQRLTLSELADEHPESSDLIQRALSIKSIAGNRPPLTDTQGWMAALDAVASPVDPESGRRIFHHTSLAKCSNCHRHRGRGNVVGPDLSRVGDRDDRHWLLQSLLEPSRQMSPEYLPRTIVLNSGLTFTGIRLRSSTKEAMRDANGKTRSFNRDDIESMVESTVSFMPDGIVNTLTIREIRDLIAFLESNVTEE